MDRQTTHAPDQQRVLRTHRALAEQSGDADRAQPPEGRQRRLRVGDAWYRIDLLFYHRRLKCLVIIDIKTGDFTHADAGQMHLYCNYAREHWTLPDENPPMGLILCDRKDDAVVDKSLRELSRSFWTDSKI
jgi:hypothetical protein